MSDADKRERTVLGLILMAFGLVIFSIVMLAMIKTGHPASWPLVALSALPLGVSLMGALIAWPDQVGPILQDVLAKWKGASRGPEH